MAYDRSIEAYFSMSSNKNQVIILQDVKEKIICFNVGVAKEALSKDQFSQS